MGQNKKYAVFLGLFAFWYIGDMWTKHWADVALADAFHPLNVRIGADQVGQSLGDVLTERTGIDAAELDTKVMPFVRRLGEPLAVSSNDPVFRSGGPGADNYGLYVFWRGLDDAPRRVDKIEPRYLTRWMTWAMPEKSAAQVSDMVREHLDGVTFDAWLERRIPKVDAEDVAELGAGGQIFAVERRPVRPKASDKVAEGEISLLEHRRIDVMGSWTDQQGDTGRKAAPWFQFLYAENPGAAFGFMRGIPQGPRNILFFVLGVLAFVVIIGIAYTLPASAWWLHVGLGSILAGAAGNFTDRVRYGYVIDFIDMDLGFMHWPTYNIADIAIAVGVGLLLGDMLFNKQSPLVREDPKKKKAADAKDGEEAAAEDAAKDGKKSKKGNKKAGKKKAAASAPDGGDAKAAMVPSEGS